MRLLLSIILITIIVCNAVDCMQYKSEIGVRGDGYLFASSNTALAKDRINSEGEQNYYRSYIDQNDRSLFISKYNLTNSSAKRDPAYIKLANGTIDIPNDLTNPIGKRAQTYSIGSVLSGGPVHFMGMSSYSTMTAANWVERNASGVTTNFRGLTDGELTEIVLDKNYASRPKFLAETEAEGNITFAAGLNTNVTNEFEADADRLLKSLDATPMLSEVAIVDIPVKSARVSQNGKVSATISDSTSKTVTVGNIEAAFEANSTVTTDQDIEDKYNAIKDKPPVSDFKDIGLYRVITMKDVNNVQELTLEMGGEPEPGSNLFVGDQPTITIKVTNFGKSKLHSVTVSDKLPNGMEFVNSINGTPADGKVVWTGIEMDADQEIVLEFTARVTDKAIGNANLESAIEAEGLTSENEKIVATPQISTYKLLPTPPAVKQQEPCEPLQTIEENKLTNTSSEVMLDGGLRK